MHKLNVFLCHASEDREVADRIQLALAGAGYNVFFDEQSLPAGTDFQGRIRQAIDESDIFVFLISNSSITKGRFTRTELQLARQKWPHPAGRVVPVNLNGIPLEGVPNYLLAATVLEIEGNAPAEVRAAVENLRPASGKRILAGLTLPWRRWLAASIVLIASVLLTVSAARYFGIVGVDPRLANLKGVPAPPFSNPPTAAQVNSWSIFKMWAEQHPDVFRDFGKPSLVKFVSIHDQPFERGVAIYDHTDAICLWLFGRDSGAFEQTDTALALAGPSGNAIDETTFHDITKGFTLEEKRTYRALVEARSLSPNIAGIGIIGGIATLYIQHRFYDRLGPPRDNEVLTADVCYASNENYQVLAGLRYDVGRATPSSPKSVYIFNLAEKDFRRHTVFPHPPQ